MAFMGKDGFVWWIGVVEERKDPKYLGRCKVRVLGWHTKDKNDMPTKELPWCMPIQPITSAAQTGVGTSPTGPVEGTWVIGFFRDGQKAQEPMMFGSIGGIPSKSAEVFEGFNDPRADPTYDPLAYVDGILKQNVLDRSNWPRDPQYQASLYNFDGTGSLIQNRLSPSTFPDVRYLGEPVTPRLARGANDKTAQIRDDEDGQFKGQSIVQVKDEFLRDTNILRAKGGPNEKALTWSEPASYYNAEYPYNHVTVSESGHVIEVDDTPKAERLHWFHRSGSFTEIGPDGTTIKKVVNNNYESIFKNNFQHVRGDHVQTVDGAIELLAGARGGKDGSFYVKGGQITLDSPLGDVYIHGRATTLDGNNLEIRVSDSVFVSADKAEVKFGALTSNIGQEIHKAANFSVLASDVSLGSVAGTSISAKVLTASISDISQELIQMTKPAGLVPTAKKIQTGFGEIVLECIDGVDSGGISLQLGLEGAVSSVKLLSGGDIELFNLSNSKLCLLSTGDLITEIASGDVDTTVSTGNYSAIIDQGDIILTAKTSNIELDAGGLLEAKAGAQISLTSETDVVLEAPSIKLGKNATQPLMMGQGFIEAYSKHNHGTGTGPSGPILDASPYASVLSEKCFIE
jgi:hypothetical protein